MKFFSYLQQLPIYLEVNLKTSFICSNILLSVDFVAVLISAMSGSATSSQLQYISATIFYDSIIEGEINTLELEQKQNV